MVAPEGWPLILTLSFAFLKEQLIEDHSLFRRLAHLEVLGLQTNRYSKSKEDEGHHVLRWGRNYS